jgi:hypothetical protein
VDFINLDQTSEPGYFRHAELDGRHIVYTANTVFKVQVGKGSKGNYKTKYCFKGELGLAVLYYRGINIGRGYKKRLLGPSMDKPVLARQFSY